MKSVIAIMCFGFLLICSQNLLIACNMFTQLELR